MLLLLLELVNEAHYKIFYVLNAINTFIFNKDNFYMFFQKLIMKIEWW